MDTKPTNPKDIIGSAKLPLHLWPTTATILGALALMDGALKYGRSNWREAGVRATIYVDAARRHLDAWLEGEDDADDSSVPHLGHALACIAILIDAQAHGKLVDDRLYGDPRDYRRFVDTLTERVKVIQANHADKSPKHYTIEDMHQPATREPWDAVTPLDLPPGIPSDMFDADGNYIPGAFRPKAGHLDETGAEYTPQGMEKRLSEQAIDAAVASRAVGVATPVDARPTQTGYDALFDGEKLLDFASESDFQWCYNASPPRAGHVWQCERPEGHAGDHAWNPLRNGWTREWAEDKVTRWADSHLTLVPAEEELPDE